MKYSKSAIGLLTAQYRSVLRKCWMINVGLFALGAALTTATPAEALDGTSVTVYGDSENNYTAGNASDGSPTKMWSANSPIGYIDLTAAKINAALDLDSSAVKRAETADTAANADYATTAGTAVVAQKVKIGTEDIALTTYFASNDALSKVISGATSLNSATITNGLTIGNVVLTDTGSSTPKLNISDDTVIDGTLTIGTSVLTDTSGTLSTPHLKAGTDFVINESAAMTGIDTAVTSGNNTKLITSGAVYSAIDEAKTAAATYTSLTGLQDSGKIFNGKLNFTDAMDAAGAQITTNKTNIATNTQAISDLNGAVNNDKSVLYKIANNAQTATFTNTIGTSASLGAAANIQDAINNVAEATDENADAIDTLTDDTKNGSIAKRIYNNADDAKHGDTTIGAAITANATAIDTLLNGSASTAGSLNKFLADNSTNAVTDGETKVVTSGAVYTAIDAAKAAAASDATTKVEALADGAVATNTQSITDLNGAVTNDKSVLYKIANNAQTATFTDDSTPHASIDGATTLQNAIKNIAGVVDTSKTSLDGLKLSDGTATTSVQAAIDSARTGEATKVLNVGANASGVKVGQTVSSKFHGLDINSTAVSLKAIGSNDTGLNIATDGNIGLGVNSTYGLKGIEISNTGQTVTVKGLEKNITMTNGALTADSITTNAFTFGTNTVNKLDTGSNVLADGADRAATTLASNATVYASISGINTALADYATKAEVHGTTATTDVVDLGEIAETVNVGSDASVNLLNGSTKSAEMKVTTGSGVKNIVSIDNASVKLGNMNGTAFDGLTYTAATSTTPSSVKMGSGSNTVTASAGNLTATGTITGATVSGTSVTATNLTVGTSTPVTSVDAGTSVVTEAATNETLASAKTVYTALNNAKTYADTIKTTYIDPNTTKLAGLQVKSGDPVTVQNAIDYSKSQALGALKEYDGSTDAASVQAALASYKTGLKGYTDDQVEALADGQVTLNKTAITLLNNDDDTVSGSVLNTVKIKAETATFTDADTPHTSVGGATTIQGAIRNVANAVDVLNGTGAGSVAKSITDGAQEATFTKTIGTSASLGDAATIGAAINNVASATDANTAKFAGLNGDTVQAAINAASTAAGDTYVKKSYLAGTDGAITIGKAYSGTVTDDATNLAINTTTGNISAEVRNDDLKTQKMELSENGITFTTKQESIPASGTTTKSVAINNGAVTADGDITAANFSTAGKLTLGAQELTADKIVAYDGYETRIAANTTAIDTINGANFTAAKATADADGNVISSTYAKLNNDVSFGEVATSDGIKFSNGRKITNIVTEFSGEGNLSSAVSSKGVTWYVGKKLGDLGDNTVEEAIDAAVVEATTYDNTASGLEATTVQGAIDENAGNISANKDAIAKLNGDTDDTSVNKKIKNQASAATYTESTDTTTIGGKIADNASRIADNEAKFFGMTDDTVQESINAGVSNRILLANPAYTPTTTQYMKTVLANLGTYGDKAVSVGAMGQFIQEIGYNMKQDQLGWDINVDTSNDDSFAKKLTSDLYKDLKYNASTNTTDRTVVSALNVAGDAIETLNGDKTIEGSVDYKVYNNAKDAVYSIDTTDPEAPIVTTIKEAIDDAKSGATEALADVLDGTTPFTKLNVNNTEALAINNAGTAISADEAAADDAAKTLASVANVYNTVNTNAEGAKFTDDEGQAAHASIAGATTIGGAIKNVAGAVDTNTTHIGTWASLKAGSNAMTNRDPETGEATTDATTLVEAVNNISDTLGTIHGLRGVAASGDLDTKYASQDKPANWYKNGAGNLFDGSGVDDQFAEVAASIGDRSQFLTGHYTSETTPATEYSVADAIMNMDTNIYAKISGIENDYVTKAYFNGGDETNNAISMGDDAKTITVGHVADSTSATNKDGSTFTVDNVNGKISANVYTDEDRATTDVEVSRYGLKVASTTTSGATATTKKVVIAGGNVTADGDVAAKSLTLGTSDAVTSVDDGSAVVTSASTNATLASAATVYTALDDAKTDATNKIAALTDDLASAAGTTVVDGAHITNGTITTDKIKDKNVTWAKLSNGVHDTIKNNEKAINLLNDTVDKEGSVLNSIYNNAKTADYDGTQTIADAIAANTAEIAERDVELSTKKVGHVEGVQIATITDGTDTAVTLTETGLGTFFDAKQKWMDKEFGIDSGDLTGNPYHAAFAGAKNLTNDADTTMTGAIMELDTAIGDREYAATVPYLSAGESVASSLTSLANALGDVATGYVTKDYFNGKDGATVQMGIESDDVQVGKQNYSGTTPVSLMSGIRIFKDTSGTSTDRVITIGSNNADANDFKGIKISENGQTVSMGSLDNANAKIVTVKDGNVTADDTVQATKFAFSAADYASGIDTNGSDLNNLNTTTPETTIDGHTIATTGTVKATVDGATVLTDAGKNYAANSTVKNAIVALDTAMGDRAFADTHYAKLDNTSYELTKAITNLDTALYTVAGDYVSKTYFNNGDDTDHLISMGSGATTVQIGKVDAASGLNGIKINNDTNDKSIVIGTSTANVTENGGNLTATGDIKGANLEATAGLKLAGSEVTSIDTGSALGHTSEAADADKKILATNATVINSVKALADGEVATNTQNIAKNTARFDGFDSDTQTVAQYVNKYAKDGIFVGTTTIGQSLDALTDNTGTRLYNEISGTPTGSKAIIFNENDGGGAKFEHEDGTWSAVAVNNGGANGLAAQIYAVNHSSKEGARIDVSTSGMYYTVGNDALADRMVKANEIVTYSTAKDGIYSVDAATGDETTIAEAIAAIDDRFGEGTNLRAFDDGETIADYVDALAETATFTPDATDPAASLGDADTINEAINNVAGAVDDNLAAIGDRKAYNATHYANPGSEATDDPITLSQAIKNMDDNIYAKLGDVAFADGMYYVEAGDTVTGAITHLDTKVGQAISGLDDKFVTWTYFNGGDTTGDVDTNPNYGLISMGGDSKKIWIGKQAYTSGGEPDELKTGIEVITTGDNKGVKLMADANNGLTVSATSVGLSLSDSGINTVITANNDGTIAIGTKSGANVTGISLSDEGNVVTIGNTKAGEDKVTVSEGVITADDSVVVGDKTGDAYVEIEDDLATFKGANGTVTIADGTVTAKQFAFDATHYATGIDNLGGVFTAEPANNYTIATTRTVYDNTTVEDAANGNYAAGSVIAALGSVDTAIGNRDFSGTTYAKLGNDSGELTKAITNLDEAIVGISDDYVTWNYFNNGDTTGDADTNPNYGLVSMGSGANNILIGKTTTDTTTHVTTLDTGLGINNTNGNVMLGQIAHLDDGDAVETGVNVDNVNDIVSLVSANGTNSVNAVDVSKTTIKLGMTTTDSTTDPATTKFAGVTINNGIMTNANPDTTSAEKATFAYNEVAVTDGTSTSSMKADTMKVSTDETHYTATTVDGVEVKSGDNTANMSATEVKVAASDTQYASTTATSMKVVDGNESAEMTATTLTLKDNNGVSNTISKTGMVVANGTAADADKTTINAGSMSVSKGDKVATVGTDAITITDGDSTTTIDASSVTSAKFAFDNNNYATAIDTAGSDLNNMDPEAPTTTIDGHTIATTATVKATVDGAIGDIKKEIHGDGPASTVNIGDNAGTTFVGDTYDDHGTKNIEGGMAVRISYEDPEAEPPVVTNREVELAALLDDGSGVNVELDAADQTIDLIADDGDDKQTGISIDNGAAEDSHQGVSIAAIDEDARTATGIEVDNTDHTISISSSNDNYHTSTGLTIVNDDASDKHTIDMAFNQENADGDVLSSDGLSIDADNHTYSLGYEDADGIKSGLDIDSANSTFKLAAVDTEEGTTSGLNMDAANGVYKLGDEDATNGTTSGLKLDTDSSVYTLGNEDTAAGTKSGLEIDANSKEFSLMATDENEGTASGLSIDAANNTFTLGAVSGVDTEDETFYGMTMDANEGITAFIDQDGEGVIMNRGDLTATNSATVGDNTSENYAEITQVKDEEGNVTGIKATFATESGNVEIEDGAVTADNSVTIGDSTSDDYIEFAMKTEENPETGEDVTRAVAKFASSDGSVDIERGEVTADNKVTVGGAGENPNSVVLDSDGNIVATNSALIGSEDEDEGLSGVKLSADGTAVASTSVMAGTEDEEEGLTGVKMDAQGDLVASNSALVGTEDDEGNLTGVKLDAEGNATASKSATIGDSASDDYIEFAMGEDGAAVATFASEDGDVEIAGGSIRADNDLDVTGVGTFGDESKVVIDEGNIDADGDITAKGTVEGDAIVADSVFELAGTQVHSIDTGKEPVAESGDVLATTASIYRNAENADYHSAAGEYYPTADANTINEAFAAIDNVIGKFPSDLNLENLNLGNGEEVAPKDIVEAFNNIDATLGKIHHLANDDGTVNNAKSTVGNGTNLAKGTTVEQHLVSLDNAIGNRTDYQSQNVIKNNQAVAESLEALDAAVGDISQLRGRNFVDAENLSDAVVQIDDKLSNLDTRVERNEKDLKDVHHELRRGMASMAAMSALVPNSRSTGKTSLSVGTGAYSGHNAVAVGGFHYLTDNLMFNAGAAWSNSRDAVYRVGMTYSF